MRCRWLILLLHVTQLDSLKRGRGIRKDNDDVTISANLYDPDDVKSRKSNKRTEEEQALKCECVATFDAGHQQRSYDLGLQKI